MIKEASRMVIEENLNKIGSRLFQKSEIVGISWQTFKKYVEVEDVCWEELKEVSIEEAVELLNSCAGNECWNAYWEYRVVDNKIYEVIKRKAKKIVAKKF